MRVPKLHLHPLTLPLLGLLFALSARAARSEPLFLLLGVLVHEGGHLLALRLCAVPMQDICISVRGVRIHSPLSTLSYGREALVLAAGAAANVLLALLLWLCGMPHAAMPSLALAFYNLLPLTSFDGGRLLSLLLCSLTELPLRTVYILCRTVSHITQAILYLFCGWFFWEVSLGGGAEVSMLGGAWFFSVFGIMTEHLQTAKMNNSGKIF